MNIPAPVPLEAAAASGESEPLMSCIALLTQSEIVQICIQNGESGWTPLKQYCAADALHAAERFIESFSRRIAAAVLQSRTPMDVVDTGNGVLRDTSMHGSPVRSFGCYPLEIEERSAGVIFFASRKPRGELSEESMATLACIAKVLGVLLVQEACGAGANYLYDATRQSAAHGILSADPTVCKIIDLLPRIAQSDAPVLISGETGTGKELIARALHRLSPRARKPFVTVHCGALTQSLLESELFGHVKGAFTGANRESSGYFGLADGGSIFLDEISTATPEVQVKLLRVLESGELTPVGSAVQRRVDVRIIVAGNENLEQLVRQNRFRKDLYYRLKVLEIYLPPLRERKGDIRLLAGHWLRHYARKYAKPLAELSDEVLAELQRRSWEGNIRQLRHTIERLVVLAEPNLPVRLDMAHLRESESLRAAGQRETLPPVDAAVYPSYEDFKQRVLYRLERDYLIQVLQHKGWSESPAARSLGIPRSTLVGRMAALAIEKPSVPRSTDREQNNAGGM